MEDFAGRPDDYERTWQDLYKEGHGSIGLTPICGPNDLSSRYLTEDIPFGLVPWAAIAELIGVPMPLTNGFIDIINVVHERDWREKSHLLTFALKIQKSFILSSIYKSTKVVRQTLALLIHNVPYNHTLLRALPIIHIHNPKKQNYGNRN